MHGNFGKLVIGGYQTDEDGSNQILRAMGPTTGFGSGDIEKKPNIPVRDSLRGWPNYVVALAQHGDKLTEQIRVPGTQ